MHQERRQGLDQMPSPAVTETTDNRGSAYGARAFRAEFPLIHRTACNVAQ